MRGTFDNFHSGVNCSDNACAAPHFRQDAGHESLRRPVLVLSLALFLSRDRSLSRVGGEPRPYRSEEHTSELQSLMRISYAVFCLKKNNKQNNKKTRSITNI